MYNAGAYLSDAINSLMNQTYREFELLIINDASTDDTAKILAGYNDERITVFHSDYNRGYLHHLNEALKIAKGTYIARMDADDISTPDRLEKQVAFLQQHPKISIVGCNLSLFKEKISDSIGAWLYPADAAACKARLLFYPCHAHPAVMFRRALVDSGQYIYDPAFYSAEDYELWSRLSDSCEMSNIQETLFYYRISDTQVSSAKRSIQQTLTNDLRINNLKQYLPVSTQLEDLIRRTWQVNFSNEWSEVKMVLESYMMVLDKVEPLSFRIELSFEIKKIVYIVFDEHRRVIDWYRQSAFKLYAPFSIAEKIKFSIKTMLVKR